MCEGSSLPEFWPTQVVVLCKALFKFAATSGLSSCTAQRCRPIRGSWAIASALPHSPNIQSERISRYAQVRVAGHNVALERGRRDLITAGSGLVPIEMKHRAYILHV